MFHKQIVVLVVVALGAALGEAPPFPASDVLANTVTTGPQYPAPGQQPSPSASFTKWDHPESDQTISLQSGYEGYLVPAEPALSLGDIIGTTGLLALAPSIGKIGLKLALKVGVWFGGLAALFLLGSIVTSTICTLTPFCTISFAGYKPFSKESVRSLISEERLNSATQFVMEAVKKYRNLNKKSESNKAE